MVTYTHNYLCLTPKMESNTTFLWGVSASSSYHNYPPYNAFGHSVASNNAESWLTSGATYGWLKFDFGEGNDQQADSYTVAYDGSTALLNRAPKTWTLQGSNNDSGWTILDTQTNVAAWTEYEMREYVIASPDSYRYYKMDITASQGSGYLTVGELELIGVLKVIGEPDPVDVIDVSDFKYTGKVYYYNTNLQQRNNYSVKLVLNKDNFNFDLAQEDGFDFRLAERSNGSGVFRMWVASWDKNNEHAVLWFKIPHLSSDLKSTFYAFWGTFFTMEDISIPRELDLLFYETFKPLLIDFRRWDGIGKSSISTHGYLFPNNSSFTTMTNPLNGKSSWVIEAGVYLVNDTSCDLNDRAHGFGFIGDENGFIINIMHDTRVEHNATYPGGTTYQNIDQTYGGLEFDSYQEHYIAYYEPEDRIYQRIVNRKSYEDIENKIDRKVEGDTRINNVRLYGRQTASTNDGAYPSYISWFVIREYDNLNLSNLDGSELYVQYENVEHQPFDYKEYTDDLTLTSYTHKSSFGGDAYNLSNDLTDDIWMSDTDAVSSDPIYVTIYFDRKENLVSTRKYHYDSGHEKFYNASKMSDSDTDIHERDHWRAETKNGWAVINFGNDRPIINVFGIRAVSDDLDSCPKDYKFYGGLENYTGPFKLLCEGTFEKIAEWQSITFDNKSPYKYYKFEIINTYGNNIRVQEWEMYEYTGFDKPKYISQLRLHPADFGGLEDNFPKQISLEGSNDTLNWETVMPWVDTYTPYISHNFSYGKWQRYSFTNIKGYWHYRLACKDNWGATDGRIIIGEWEMCELIEEANIHRILGGQTNNIRQIWTSDNCGFEDEYGLIYIGNEKLNIVQYSKLVEEKEISEFYDDINVV